jgi:hypothetical protein
MKTQAEACIPIVLEKTSILSPIKKDKTNRSHGGVSNGSSRINKI